MKKSKKALWISVISLDVAITIFLFVISIIMIATMPKTSTDWKLLEQRGAANFIEYLQLNGMVYLFACVVPLFILLVANVIGVIWYLKKGTPKKKVTVSDLSDEQKEALRKELLSDLEKK